MNIPDVCAEEELSLMLDTTTIDPALLALWQGKRFYSLNAALRKQFHTKIVRVMLDAGYTCPNRDGTIATGGCTFCSARGSGDFAGSRREDLSSQFMTIRDRQRRKWPRAQYLAYFQAYTNTYAPVDVLRQHHQEVLRLPDVVGLSIATRPDCLPPDVLAYLAELNQQTYLWVELGLQTMHERTSTLINRAHTTEQFVTAVQQLRAHNIRVCAHIIYGLPQETHDMMHQTAAFVSQLDIQGIKIHLLHLMRNTPMVRQYEAGLLRFLERDEYVALVVHTLEHLPPHIIAHRLTGDAPREKLIGPLWSADKWPLLNAIDAELLRLDTWQGRKWTK